MQLIKILKIYLNVNTMFIIHYENTFRVYHYFIAHKKIKFIDDSPLCFTFHKFANTWVPKKLGSSRSPLPLLMKMYPLGFCQYPGK